MQKHFLFIFSLVVLGLVVLGAKPAAASSDHRGQIVKMNGLSTLYYVAEDEKRYVFPNVKIFNSWFTDFDDVATLSENMIKAIPLGGNVLYRPGVLLVKITTDPKVYAVSRGGVLRWVKTEAVARALYGDDWNLLIDDVPDSFFTNYAIGVPIADSDDYDPDEELRNALSIDANRGLGQARAKLAKTIRCRIMERVGHGPWRHCGGDSGNDDADEEDDGQNPYITSIRAYDEGEDSYIDATDRIDITFSEAIDPASINNNLTAGSFVTGVPFSSTGGVSISSAGLLVIEDIASFDVGAVNESETFSAKLDLSGNSKILTVTIIGGSVRITDEDFRPAAQVGGVIADKFGHKMPNNSDIGLPLGTFGGENVDDDIDPFIEAIKVTNYGSEDYIDVDDEIEITFSEAIEPASIHADLSEDGSVDNVDAEATGGVSVSGTGILTIADIAAFYVGDVDQAGAFDVSLALDDTGRILTITLAQGDDIEVDNEDLDSAKQIGDTVEDLDGNEMDDDPRISDPTGSFIDNSAGSDPYITGVKVYDNGFEGYIDENDKIVITFNEAIDPESLNDGLEEGGQADGVDPYDPGGVHINNNGLFVITDILSFDVGSIESGGEFEVELRLSSNGEELSVVLASGGAIAINEEEFSGTTQIGGTVYDLNENVMNTNANLDEPDGTFGGESADSPPYISKIEIENGDRSNRIDEGDRIIITFNEAIDPDSIDNDLAAGDSIEDVDEDDTGGVVVKSSGFLVVTGITEFYAGDVEDNGQFEVDIALNDLGNRLTITLADGNDIDLDDQELDDAEQVGGIIKDEEGNLMEDDPHIDDPTGDF